MACDFGEMFLRGGSSSYRKNRTLYGRNGHTRTTRIEAKLLRRIELIYWHVKGERIDLFTMLGILRLGGAKKETIFTRETFIYTLQMKVNWRAINLYGSLVYIYIYIRIISSCVCNKVKRIHKETTLKFNRISREDIFFLQFVDTLRILSYIFVFRLCKWTTYYQ